MGLVALSTLIFCASATAQTTQPVDYRVTEVRLLPADGHSTSHLRLTGSNQGETNGFREIAKLDAAPGADGWVRVAVPAGAVYRYVKVEAGETPDLAIAELEFYSAAGKLPGKPFATSIGKEKDANEKAIAAAFDGDPATAYTTTLDHAYVGVDLGDKVQVPAVWFEPKGGAYERPVKLKLHMWPPGPTVRYTTDGSTPSRTHGEIYTEPFEVTRSMSIAAFAFQDGRADGRVSVQSYLIGSAQTLGPQIRSYHIGNSLTDTVNGHLEPVAQSGGKNLFFMRKTIPGTSIIGNWQSNGKGFASPEAWANDYERVLREKVDHLFLQPFPNPPGLYRDGEYGLRFIKLAREANPDVQPWLYAQWVSYPGVDASGKVTAAYCDQIGGHSWDKEEPEAWHPPIPKAKVKTWDDAMTNTMAYYREIQERWNAVPGNKPVKFCPGGPALLRLKKAIAAGEVPGAADFGAFAFTDGLHLTGPAAYLVSLVHYASMFNETPEGKVTWATAGVTPEQARVLQRLAWETVQQEKP